MRMSALLLLTLTAPGAVLAQQPPMRGQMAGGGIAAVQPLYEMAKGWLVRSAEMMPEENYSFKPTPDVRSFGELVGHVANAGYLFCSAAKGEQNPNGTDFEKTTAKAALVQGIKDAFAYCDGAYQMTGMRLMDEVTLFGSMKGSRLWVLMFNVAHDNEHYGNMVTYLRLKGMVPPSSQGGM